MLGTLRALVELISLQQIDEHVRITLTADMREVFHGNTTVYLVGQPRTASWHGMEDIQIIILLIISAINITVVALVTAFYFVGQKQNQARSGLICARTKRKGDSLSDYVAGSMELV
jgi:hypothetical protein